MNGLPWIEPYWDALWQAYQPQGSQPHAWVISGPHGGGKLQIPMALAAHLLCQSQNNCATCKGCSLLAAGTHPDFIHIAPEEGKTLRIQSIRWLIEQLEQTPHQGGWRMALIEDADTLSISAANALLKTLEEPPSKTVMVLLVAQTSRLPATILSRCQQLFVPLPEPSISLAWLVAQGHEAEKAKMALKAADNAPNIAKSWLEDDLLPQWQLWQDHFKRFLNNQMQLSELKKEWVELDDQALKWLFQWFNEKLLNPSESSVQHHQAYQKLLSVQSQWHMNLNKSLLIQQLLMDLKQNERSQ